VNELQVKLPELAEELTVKVNPVAEFAAPFVTE
jgi:hypothetical protein